MKVASLDLGTNTFLCLIAEVNGPELLVIEDHSQVVRLGEKVNQNRAFLPEALNRSAQCLDRFASIIKKNKVGKIIATATSAARDVKNGQALLDLGQERGIPISIIAGAKEAQLSFEGAVSGLPTSQRTHVCVVDVGGGSTEIIFRNKESDPIKAVSYDVGCVRLSETYLHSDPIEEKEYFDLLHHSERVLSQFGSVECQVVVAVAGTPTTLACIAQEIDFDETKVEGFVLTQESIEEMITRLSAMPLAQRQKVKGLDPKRADVIIAGGALLIAAMKAIGKKEMRVSTRGLRYGAAIHYKEFP